MLFIVSNYYYLILVYPTPMPGYLFLHPPFTGVLSEYLASELEWITGVLNLEARLLDEVHS